MKRILHPKPSPLYGTYCPECGAIFEYEIEDILGGSTVECPICDHPCDHSSSNIKR